MVANLPIMMLKVPSLIVLERSLDYRPIASVDVVEAVVYYVWAVAAVALGAGVWGVATAVTARAVAGAATMARVGPVGLIRPRWSWADVRPLLRFGGKFQANVLIAVARDQGLNIAVAAITGVATLGVWSLAWRFLQIAVMVFGSLGRVAYPLMARLLGAGQEPAPVIERGAAALAVIASTMMVALTAFAPALPVLVGDGWEQVPAVLLWAGMALIVWPPVVLVTTGYLFAVDAGGRVVLATLSSSIIWFVVALPLLPELGAPAMGIGWCAATLVNAAIVGRIAAARSGSALAASAFVPVAVGIAAAAGGWALARRLDGSVAAGVLAVAAGEAALFAALALLRRDALSDTRGLVSQAIHNLTGA
jgi:O-antigen/teichoic acid export membrane protein